MKYLIPLLFSLSIGCASMPVTDGTRQIEAVKASGILDIKKGDTPQTIIEKKEIVSAFNAAEVDIKAAKDAQAKAETAQKKAEQKAASNAAWAHRGKVGAWIGAGIGVLLLLGTIFGIMRRVGVIP